ncbi:MAG: kelch repeat-containing protein, partial [Bacteroidota bacterium]
MKFSTKALLVWLLLYVSVATLHAQIGINTDNAAPDSSAILDLKSSRQGFLYPRMTTTERDAILRPAIGLTIFNLDDQCTDIYDGTTWMKDCPLRDITDSLDLDNWVLLSNGAPFSRSNGAAFSINGKGYFVTGSPWDNTSQDLYEYDPVQNSWDQKASFPGTPRSGAVGFALDGKGYIGLGSDINNHYQDMYAYDPATDSWSTVAAFPGIPRTEAFSFTINNKAYVGGGSRTGGTQVFNDLYEYDSTTDSWTPKTDLPGGERTNAVAFAIDGKGYVGGGFNFNLTIAKQFYAYDPSLDTWSEIAPFSGPVVSSAGSFSLNGKGYVVTGTGQVGSVLVLTNGFYEYNPTSNSWTQQPNFPGPERSFTTTLTIDNQAFLIGGIVAPSYNIFNDVWKFNGDIRPVYQLAIPAGGVILENSSIADLDQDTRIQVEATTDEDVIRFDIAGTEAMVINSTGKVGVNTSNPQAELEVIGTVSADSFVGNGSQLTGIPGDDLGNHTASTNIQLGTNWLSSDGDNEGVFIDPTGKVGIGIGTPQ